MKSALVIVAKFALVAALLSACGGRDSSTGPALLQTPLNYQSVTHGAEVSSDYQEVVQRIYISCFGRPVEPAGLAYWTRQFREAGMPTDLATIISEYDKNPTVRTFVDFFSNSKESSALYAGDNDAFISAIYRNIFSREPDIAGKAYWVDLLNRGGITRAFAAMAIMAAARSTDRDIVGKKLSVATEFTGQLATQQQIDAYDGMEANSIARGMLADVVGGTDPAASVIIASAIGKLVELRKAIDGQQYLGFGFGTPIDGAEKFGLMPLAGGTPVAGFAGELADVQDVVPRFTLSQGVLSNFQGRYMVGWSNQHLVRQDLFSNGAVPISAQVSSLSMTEVCEPGVPDGSLVGEHGMDPSGSWLVFRKAGSDSKCNTADDTFVAVRMDMGPAEAPLVIDQPVKAVRADNGEIEGWLVRRNQHIFRVNSEFAYPVQMFDLPATDLVSNDRENQSQFNLFFFISDGALYVWDASSTSRGVPTLVTRLSTERVTGIAAIDSREVFVLINSGGFTGYSRIVRYSPGDRSVSTVGSVSGIGSSVSMLLTPTRVVLYGESGIATLNRRGGNAQQNIYFPGVTAGLFLAQVDVAGERIWVSAPSSGAVATINSDGTGKQIFDNATYAGCFQKKIIDMMNDANGCEAVVLIQNGSVRAYGAADANLRVRYGDITTPLGATSASLGVFPPSWGENAMLTVLSASGSMSVSQTNFFLKSDAPGLTEIHMP